MPQLDDQALRQLFLDARTHNRFTERAVQPQLLQQLYDITRWGPTSANCSPMRVVFVVSPEAKARLLPCMSEGNREKTQQAPVNAIVGMDYAFHEHMPVLFPHSPGMRENFASNPDAAATAALRNGSLQGGYFILAARALGLDCGPMGGFDAEAVRREFFAGTEVRPNFVCNLGYGDPAGLRPRGPRLDFAQACQVL